MPTGHSDSGGPTLPGLLRRPIEVSIPTAAAEMLSHAPPDHLPASVTVPTARVESYLEQVVREAGLPRNLTDGMLYSLLGPGKRARPLLVWHSFAAVAPHLDPAGCLPAAAALELIHCFSLVHDDLPGLDNDDLRRGRPTLHRQTSEALAVLAGDSLLTLGFQVLVERSPNPGVASKLVHELATSTNAMIAGQVYDTLGGFPPGLSDSGHLELVHRNKTGMLIRAACRMGAISAIDQMTPGHIDNPVLLSAITSYAEAVGLMFQIVDDLLDVTQTTHHLGKKAGKDAEAGKLTYPGVFGIEHSRSEVRRLHAASLAALEPLGPSAEPLRVLSSYMAVRTR